MKTSKVTNRERLLEKGFQVMHERGFVGASVRDIVQAAGVPQGSFTNHFVSKEAFSLEVLNLYFSNVREVIAATLLNESLAPLDRLRAYLEANINSVQTCGVKNGCLFGNFTAEASDHSEMVRLRLVEIYEEIQEAIATSLRAAVKAGDLARDLDCRGVAEFIFTWLEGAFLLAKGQRSLTQLERTKEILFAMVLGQKPAPAGSSRTPKKSGATARKSESNPTARR